MTPAPTPNPRSGSGAPLKRALRVSGSSANPFLVQVAPTARAAPAPPMATPRAPDAAPEGRYTAELYKAAANRFDAASNPGGAIVLSVAENALSKPAIADALATLPPLPASELGYSFNHGSRETREVIAHFLERHHTHHRVDPDALVLASGIGSLNDALASILCEPDDAVLTFAPGYRGHLQHFGHRAGVRLVLADLHDATLPRPRDDARCVAVGGAPPLTLCVEALQRAWLADGGEEDSRIRAVLVSSPHNPTGEVLTAATVSAIVAWARERHLQLIFDEVYGNSVHDAGAVFRSVADVLHNELRDDVHVTWSVSKDLSMAGVRLAALLSHSRHVIDTVKARFALFSSPSRLAQWAVSSLLADDEWTARFIEDNAVRLRLAYDRCVRHLRALRVPFIPAEAGFFVVADLRSFMRDSSPAAEMELWLRMCDSGVLLTPSHECLGMRCGFFRICFASVNLATQEVAWQRLKDVLRRS